MAATAPIEVEFALTVLDVQREDGQPIENGDQVFFTHATTTAKSCNYFGLHNVFGHDIGAKAERWTGQAFDIQQLVEKIKETRPETKHVVFFIHGFNNQPLEALRTYQQLSETLTGQSPDVLLIPVIWACSNYVLYTPQYYADHSIAALAGLALGRAFEHYFRTRTDDFQLHFYAHSMGNRVLDKTIAAFAEAVEASELSRLVQTIWSVAADVPNDTLAADQTHWSDLAKRVCVYYSHSDNCLRLSEAANILAERRMTGRLGATGPDARSPVSENVHAFDCQSFNRKYDHYGGHSYQLATEILQHVRLMIGFDCVPAWPFDEKERRKKEEEVPAEQAPVEDKKVSSQKKAE